MMYNNYSSLENIMSKEIDRLRFLEIRDGTFEAKCFALRTMRIYKAALKTKYGKVYRRTLIESIICFRKYLRE